MAVSADGDNLYIMGGCASYGCCQLDSVYAYSISQRLWARTASLYTKTAFFTSGVLRSVDGATDVHMLGGYTTSDCSTTAGLVGTATVSDQHTVYKIPSSGPFNSTRLQVRRKTLHVPEKPHAQFTQVRRASGNAEHPHSSRSGPTLLPGVDSLGRGYNLLKGNPLSTSGGDPGWSTRSILDFGCSGCLDNATVLEGRFLVPPGVSVNALRSCSFETKETTIRNGADLQETMSTHVKLRAGLFVPLLLFGARFTQSDSFAQHAEAKMSQSTVSVSSSATCDAYTMALEDYQPIE